ncbi:DNA-processing protein DprA [Nitratidesulfovibrio sp. D1]|uniref:DNA-processing protein DprA n=1 Tax=Nitratidesulfovibrio sp. D1 TaxID=3440151 RepID=UPI003EBCF46B
MAPPLPATASPDATGSGSATPGPAALPAFADLDAAGRAELWAALALRHSPGIGPRTVRRLLAGLGSALAAVQAAEGGGHGWARAGVRSHMAAPVANGAWRESARQEWDAVRGCRCGILLWTDPRYPARLREISDAPAVLYCRGDASLLANHAVAVVGSRLCSRAGRGVSADIAYSLSAAGVTVVSGLARGIDREAHVAALQEVGSTIGVLGTGIDVVYPPEHADVFERMESTGLLVSEYAPGTLPLPAHFPVRNRIISGLSVGVLVVEAAARSGSLITARLALEQGREVYTVPGPATAQYTCGCRGLIEQGARPVTTAEDMLADLAPVLGMELAALAAPCPPPGRNGDPLDGMFPADTPAPPAPPAIRTVRTNPATPRKAARPVRNRPAAAGNVSAPVPASGGSPDEAILALLRDRPGVHVDDICRALGMGAADVSARLVLLEVGGGVRRLPGMRYERM